MQGVQRKIIERFLEWLDKSGYKLVHVGSRPERQVTTEEALDEFIQSGKLRD